MNYTSQQVQQRLDAARQQFGFANIIRVVIDEDAYACPHCGVIVLCGKHQCIRNIEGNQMNFEHIVELSDQNPMPLLARHIKMTEECGEFAEALLHQQGFLPHKTMKEPIEGEVADVIICVLDTLRAVYPEQTPAEFLAMVQYQIDKKSARWANIIEQANTVK